MGGRQDGQSGRATRDEPRRAARQQDPLSLMERGTHPQSRSRPAAPQPGRGSSTAKRASSPRNPRRDPRGELSRERGTRSVSLRAGAGVAFALLGALCVAPAQAQTCTENAVKLIRGTDSSEGEVEICSSNGFRSICDDDWDNNDARVVCRQLGYHSGHLYLGSLSDTDFDHDSETYRIVEAYTENSADQEGIPRFGFNTVDTLTDRPQAACTCMCAARPTTSPFHLRVLVPCMCAARPTTSRMRWTMRRTTDTAGPAPGSIGRRSRARPGRCT